MKIIAITPDRKTDTIARMTIQGLHDLKCNVIATSMGNFVKKEYSDEEIISQSMNLITTKPVLYVCNVDENSAKNGNEYVEKLQENVKDENAELLIISASIESEIAQLESYEDKMEFLADIGLEQSSIEKLIQKSYKLLNLITYFTAGEKEVRACL